MILTHINPESLPGFLFPAVDLISFPMNEDYKKFRRALVIVLEHEGGYVDNPDDPGGVTNYGISLRTLAKLDGVDMDGDGAADYDFNGDGIINGQDIREMGEADVRRFYYHEFWQKYSYGSLPLNVAIKVFDLSVNMGPRQAHKILQRALMANGHHLKDDGIIGSITRTLVGVTAEACLIAALRAEAAGFYRGLAAQSDNYETFLKGWLRRAYS